MQYLRRLEYKGEALGVCRVDYRTSDKVWVTSANVLFAPCATHNRPTNEWTLRYDGHTAIVTPEHS